MTCRVTPPRHCAMEARRFHLTEHRARIERRRGYVIVTLTMIFAIVTRLLML